MCRRRNGACCAQVHGHQARCCGAVRKRLSVGGGGGERKEERGDAEIMCCWIHAAGRRARPILIQAMHQNGEKRLGLRRRVERT